MKKPEPYIPPLADVKYVENETGQLVETTNTWGFAGAIANAVCDRFEEPMPLDKKRHYTKELIKVIQQSNTIIDANDLLNKAKTSDEAIAYVIAIFVEFIENEIDKNHKE